MNYSPIFSLDEVIKDLTNINENLSSTLLRFQTFAWEIENQDMLTFLKNEFAGYKDVKLVPDYRMIAPTELEINYEFENCPNTTTYFIRDKKPIIITESISIIEKWANDFIKYENPISVIRKEITIEEAYEFLPEGNKMYLKEQWKLDLNYAMLHLNASSMVEILNNVRSKFVFFGMELRKKFGSKIDINNFENQKPIINQIIYNFMKTEIHNTGDGNVVNTGNDSNVLSK